jgi:acyl CoA:acetate/3-ketoacid CoA transferase alpha subunit
MAIPERHQVADDEIEDAETACDELEDVLRARGIALPSLCVDLGAGPPLVELGRCSVETVRVLTAALQAHAAAEATQ